MFRLIQSFELATKYVLRQSCRLCATNVDLSTTLSARERAWRVAQEKYAHYPNILYSSHLESQEVHLNYRTRKILSRKLKGGQFTSLEYFNQKSNAEHQLNADNNEEQVSNADCRSNYPKNWMDDYEFYEGAVDEQGNINSIYGTADPTIAPSSVPCNGCGAHLHCASVSLPGYIPKEIFYGRTKTELQTIICQRCHFLKYYSIALDVEVTPESYIETISKIKDEFALVILIVDLLDFPCSIWPNMPELLGCKRPIFVVGNKVDLLPRDANSYLENIKDCLRQQIVKSGFNNLNIKNISLISAKTGFGIEELITQLHKIWQYKGDVYLVGCTNVGKSSLFNSLLNSDYCRPEATSLVRKAVTCPWPGTTLQMLKFPILRPSDIRVYQRFRRLFSERGQKAALEKLRRDQALKIGKTQAATLIGNVGRTFDSRVDTRDPFAMATGTNPKLTLNERSSEYQQARWCYDTPGVMHHSQITHLLTTEELLMLEPDSMIKPRAVRLKPGMSVLLAGLGRLDFLDNEGAENRPEWVKLYVFSSSKLPIVISHTTHVNEVYEKYLGTEILGVPFGNKERLLRWPGLQCCEEVFVIEGTNSIENKSGKSKEASLNCDIVLSSAGWIGLRVPNNKKCYFRTWTPNAQGIHRRTPPLIPYADRLVGKHIRNSLAYNMSKPFVFKK